MYRDIRLVTSVFCVLAAAVFVVGGTVAALSLTAGAVAVIVPQVMLLLLARRALVGAVFSWGAGKFAVTVLLLSASARFLHESGLLAAEYFVGGVVLAVTVNIALSVRMSRAL